jgi:ferredoxin-NADP reductase
MQLSLLLLAVCLICLSTGQFFIGGFKLQRNDQRFRKRQQRQINKLRSAARIARFSSELDASASKHSTAGWRVMEVVKVVDESLDAKSFYLVDPNGQALPNFHPGQYLMVRPALAGAYQTTRCYSLSIAPNSQLWRITVKRQQSDQHFAASRKSGGLSIRLHDNIRDGDCLLIGGPSGHFFLPPDNNSPMILLAAGAGITPICSMLQHSRHHTPERKVDVHYQVKDLQHWPLGPEVHSFLNNGSNGHVVTYVSRDSIDRPKLPNNLPGEIRTGRIDSSAIAARCDPGNAHYYMCGPDAWMDLMRQQLCAAGVPETRIHWESFGSGTAPAADQTQDSNAHQVKFQRSQIETQWDNPETSLWELAQSNDVMIPSGCLSGACGSCRVQLLQGTVRYDRKVNICLGEGECLTCIARPESDVIIDA